MGRSGRHFFDGSSLKGCSNKAVQIAHYKSDTETTVETGGFESPHHFLKLWVLKGKFEFLDQTDQKQFHFFLSVWPEFLPDRPFQWLSIGQNALVALYSALNLIKLIKFFKNQDEIRVDLEIVDKYILKLMNLHRWN